MTNFFTWCTALPTQQMLLNGEYRTLVRELKSCWETRRVLETLTPHREHLSRVTKRARRAMKKWPNELEEQLRDSLGTKRTPKVIEAVESLIHRIQQQTAAVLAYPPTGPFPIIDRTLYKKFKQGVPPSAIAILAQALRNAPAPVVELLAEQRRNPWLATHVVDLLMDPSTPATEISPWLEHWSRKARLKPTKDAVIAWKQWLTGEARFAPPEIESLIAYRLGLIIEGLTSLQQEPQHSNGSSAANPGAAPGNSTVSPQQPNDSRTYSIKQAAKEFNLKPWTIRNAVNRGELKCSRPTAAPNAPIMLRDADIRDWRAEQAGKRQHASRNPNLNKKA